MRYALDLDRSTLVIEARSSLGPITWESVSLAGEVDVEVDGTLQPDASSSGWLTVDLAAVTSGNTVYDGELLRRIDARRYPEATIELSGITAAEHPRYEVTGTMTFHGATRQLAGTVELKVRDDGDLVVFGEHDIDIRDFDVPAPTVLMLKIYPDVRVTLVAVLTPTG